MYTQIIEQAEAFVHNQLGDDATGHDWFHVDRVRKTALFICKQEGKGDLFIVELAALLHDIPDEKLNASLLIGKEKLDSFLGTVKLTPGQIIHIKEIIETISFKGGNNKELATIEAKIVQDADRLDALGAIGIARAFAYGGKKGQPIYNPNLKVRDEMTLEEYRNGKSSTINHFYEKLLKIKDLLNTETAKKIAENRHQIMESFLKEFYKEWNGLL